MNCAYRMIGGIQSNLAFDYFRNHSRRTLHQDRFKDADNEREQVRVTRKFLRDRERVIADKRSRNVFITEQRSHDVHSSEDPAESDDEGDGVGFEPNDTVLRPHRPEHLHSDLESFLGSSMLEQPEVPEDAARARRRRYLFAAADFEKKYEKLAKMHIKSVCNTYKMMTITEDPHNDTEVVINPPAPSDIETVE